MALCITVRLGTFTCLTTTTPQHLITSPCSVSVALHAAPLSDQYNLCTIVGVDKNETGGERGGKGREEEQRREEG